MLCELNEKENNSSLVIMLLLYPGMVVREESKTHFLAETDL